MPDSYNTIRQRLADARSNGSSPASPASSARNLLEALLKLDQTRGRARQLRDRLPAQPRRGARAVVTRRAMEPLHASSKATSARLDDCAQRVRRASTSCCTRRRSARCRARSTTRSRRTRSTSAASSTCWWRRATPKVERFVYAASSSTYGDHPGLPKVEDAHRHSRCRRMPSPSTSTSCTPTCSRATYGIERDRPALLQRVRPAPGSGRRLRGGDPASGWPR